MGAMSRGAVIRADGRAPDGLRPLRLELGYARHAEGSCLIRCGATHVLCTASVEAKPPSFLRGKGEGWVTAEYGMLPRATSERMRREARVGRQSGRTQEIQRLIGRALRAVTDRVALGERQISLDCDVLQADGGTRTAAITGGWMALWQCCRHLHESGQCAQFPLRDHVAAVSAGLCGDAALLDLDYAEDSSADVDANFVLTGGGALVEVQASAERAPFSEAQWQSLWRLGCQGAAALVAQQKAACAAWVKNSA